MLKAAAAVTGGIIVHPFCTELHFKTVLDTHGRGDLLAFAIVSEPVEVAQQLRTRYGGLILPSGNGGLVLVMSPKPPRSNTP